MFNTKIKSISKGNFRINTEDLQSEMAEFS